MQLKYKLPLILFLAYVGLVGSLVLFALANSSKQRAASQYEMAKAVAHDYSDNVRAYFSERISELKSMESGIAAMENLDDNAKAQSISALLKKLSEQPSVSNAYAVFENDQKFNYKAKDSDEWYNSPKLTKKSNLTEPYGKMVTLSHPVFINDKFIGVLGLDIELDALQKEIFGAMQNEKTGSYSFLVSNKGKIAIHPKAEMLFKDVETQSLKTAINNGEYSLVIKPEKNGDNTIISYVSMQPSGLEVPWSLGYAVPHSVLRGDELSIRYRTLGQLCLVFVLWGVFLIWLMASVFGGLTRAVAMLGKMTEGNGNLTIRLKEGGKDEIGQMSSGLNRFIEKLHSAVKIIQQETKSLLKTASKLHDLSHQLSDSSKTELAQSAEVSKETKAASDSSEAIASDANKTSANSSELASTAEQMSVNMNSVAGAVEELSSSFSLITNNTDESLVIAAQATEKAVEATKVMNTLGIAAKEIGQVTDVIKKIADKTNLLALNATIEAASAGEAGKGFTVVAGEIKELANQSAESADDITHRVDSIQSGTSSAISVIGNVSLIIKKINASIDSIANSVEQQTKASNEIANNAEQASVGAKRVVEAVSEVAETAKVSAKNASNVASEINSISGSVSTIHEDAQQSNKDSEELENMANSLKSMAEHLDSIVSKFIT